MFMLIIEINFTRILNQIISVKYLKKYFMLILCDMIEYMFKKNI